MSVELTADPYVVIEERRDSYVRYRRTDGRRWEVLGDCTGLGYCMVGAVVNGREIATLGEAVMLITESPLELDVPITPEFTGCCSFIFNEL
jgi:predicted methyltransferase